MSKVLVLNPFTLDSDSHTLEHGLKCEDETLTVQSDRDQSDINNIVRQFGLTHQLPYGTDVPAYIDYSDMPMDYHTAQNLVLEANDTFMQMSADVRSRFNHDAGAFLDFFNDPNNYDEGRKLGLVMERVSVSPPVSSAPSAPAGASSSAPAGDEGNKP